MVFLTGAPPSIPGPLAAHMQSAGERAALFKRLGAIGIVSIMNPANMDIPWERSSLARFMPSMSLADPALDETRGTEAGRHDQPCPCRQALGRLGSHVRRDRRGRKRRQAAAAFRHPGQAQGQGGGEAHRRRLTKRRRPCCPGSDPKLKDEYVVFTAHLDHLGIGKPINGDAIYNGAMDNASGIAAMLDVAAMLKERGTKLRRSVLFVAVTGEEKGLLGSKYFASSPTVDRSAIVANINTDMFLPLFPLKKLTILRYG